MALAQLSEKAAAAAWLASVDGSDGRRSSFQIAGDPSLAGSSKHARGERLTVLFDGVLDNGEELRQALGRPLHSDEDAWLLRAGYERWGADLMRHVKGIFALIIWDALEGRLFAARDPLGMHPLFYARVDGGRGLRLSTSIDVLLADARVGRTLNRAAMADQLCQRWPDPSETFFESVKRVPAGHQLMFDGARVKVERYWDPLPPGKQVKWVTKDVLEEFDSRFETAVDRTLRRGPSAIFLSGGLDSISVAAVATDRARQTAKPAPVALSLGFPDPCDEGPVQKGVATSLGIPQEFVPFWSAVPQGTMLTGALNFSRTLSAPIRGPWSPAYDYLVERGKLRGIKVVLSGLGGDELLGANALYAADLMRTGNLSGLARHVATWNRSYRFTPLRLLKTVFWTFGARPLGVSMLERAMPRALHSRRLSRSMKFAPDFVAPDLGLRAELEQRTSVALESNPAASRDLHVRQARRELDHSMLTPYLEETFERGRRLGVEFRHPLWDADLADMLFRTPQALLYGDGRAKFLIRRTVASRFPGLGLDSQKKLAATPFFRSALAAELPPIWRSMGGRLPTLGALGVVDPDLAGKAVETALQKGDRSSLGGVWELVKLEGWAASRI